MGWIYNTSPEVEAQSYYPAILAVCLVLTTLMAAVVSLRIYIHIRAGRVAADDYVIFFSMIFSIIYNATCITQTRYGLGLPLDLRPKPSLNDYLKVNFAGRPFYQLGIAGFKAALCISYLRLLSGTSQRFYKALIWFVGIVSTLGHIAGTLVLILNCTPVALSWDPTLDGTCLPFGPTNYGLAGFTIVCDVVIIILPIPLLLKLNIRTAQKAGLVCLFLLGLFTTVCSIMRITQVPIIANGHGNSTMLVLWGTIEFNVGNIISSLPFLAPLIKVFVHTVHSQVSSRYRDNTRNSSYGLKSISRGGHELSTDTTNTTVSSHGYPKKNFKSPSEELILSDEGYNGPAGAITRTVEYCVSVEKESNKSEIIHQGSP